MKRLFQHGPWPWVLLLVIVAVVVLRAPLAERLLPPSVREQLLAQANQALAEGRLSAADGSGARERFAQVLAQDPDHSGARSGMTQVGQRALAQAQQALNAGDLDTTQAMLAIARAAGAPAAATDALDTQIRLASASEASLRELLDGAQHARAEGHLDGGSDSALALYAEALARDPGNALALAGRNDALAALLTQANVHLATGDSSAALALVDRVERVDPGHLGLPAARAALAQRLGASEGDVALRLSAIDVALRDDALEGAQAMFDALAQEQPALRAEVRARLVAAWARRAITESIRGRPHAAAQARERSASGDDAPLAAHTDARIALWAARRRDGTDADPWNRLLQRWPGTFPFTERAAAAASMRDCFEQALARIELERASSCIELHGALVAGADPAARQRLAAAWLGIAEERLGAGQLAPARNALGAAMLWGADRAAVAPLRERIDSAAAQRATPGSAQR